MIDIINEAAKEFQIDILALDIMPDHLHLFVPSPPTVSVHTVVKAVKGRSSRLLRTEIKELLRLPFLWTRS